MQDVNGKIEANFSYQHILFEKAKMPKINVLCEAGRSAVVKKDIVQLCDRIHILGKKKHMCVH